MTGRLPDDETERLAPLHEPRFLDTTSVDFDDLARLVALLCGTPIAAVSLINEHYRRFTAVAGLDATQIPHDNVFCAYTVLQPGLTVVPDAQADPRYRDSPLVTGVPGIRFYVGAPLVAEDGHIWGTLCALDTTPRNLTPAQEDALRILARHVTGQLERAAERFAQATLDGLTTEVAILDGDGTILAVNQAWRRFAAANPSANQNVAEGANYLRICDEATGEEAEDAWRVAAGIRAVAAGELEQFTQDYPCHLPQEQRWFSLRVTAFPGEGEARVVISHENITERKLAEVALARTHAALAESDAGLRAVLEAAPVILYATDAEGVVTLSEGTGLAALGLKPGEAVGRSVFKFGGGDAEIEERTRQALVGEAASYDAWVYGLCLHTELRPVRTADGSITGIIGVCFDVTERMQAQQQVKEHAILLGRQKQELEKVNAELAAQATTDGLTGLRNHRAFQELLAEEVSRANRYRTPLSLIMLDVDHFKLYNDAYGHPSGDAVLAAVARVLQDCARDADLVARYGGEEFALILPQTDRDGAATLAERIRRAVENHAWPVRAVTASLGVAGLRPGKESGSDLIARADGALYRSKAAGRNRVATTPDPPPPDEHGNSEQIA